MRQRSLISRENKEQRQEVPSSSPLEKENAVQTAVKGKAKRGDKRMVNEIEDEPEKEKQNKLKLRRERNEGSKNEKVSRERKEIENEKCEGIVELNENQAQQLRKLIERKVNKTGIKLEHTHDKTQNRCTRPRTNQTKILPRLAQSKRVYVRGN